MVLMITTYQRDYVTPITNRYKFREEQAKYTQVQKTASLCDCSRKSSSKDVATSPTEAHKTNLKMEWTGIAPMGRLIEHRIVAHEGDAHLALSQQDAEKFKSFDTEPKHFLRVLNKCYPDLYEQIKQMSDSELQRRLNVERFKTTYQIDYCREPEYPEGLCTAEEDTEETNECGQIREDVDKQLSMEKKLDGKYQPGCNGRRRTDLTPAIKNNTKHWSVGPEPSNRPRLTEYRDKISRTGCVIIKNNIHNHNRCGSGINCEHQLRDECRNFK